MRRRSALELKERRDLWCLLYCCGRSSCRRSGGTCTEAFCSPSTFMFLEVSTRGVPPAHRVWCCVPTGQMFYDPGGRKEGPRECMRRNLNYHRGVVSCVAPVVNRWLQKCAQNYHRGGVFCGVCGISCGCVICVVYGTYSK